MTDTDTNTPPNPPQGVVFSPDAVQVMCEIIAMATARGAFRANELTQVGAVYDQLVKALPQKMESVPTDAELTVENETEPDGPDEEVPDNTVEFADAQLELNLDNVTTPTE